MKQASKKAVALGIKLAKESATQVVVGWNLFSSLRCPASAWLPERGTKFSREALKEFRVGLLIMPDGETHPLM